MSGPVIAALRAGEDPGPALLALNNAHAEMLSPLDAAGLARLVDGAFAALRAGEAEALLVAFDEGADYASPNFLWFRERHARFVYVDRVVVAPRARGRGLARRLYAEVIARARAAGHERLVCEVNRVPPNPVSDAFHAALGFEAVGEARLPNGRTVRYLVRDLLAPDGFPPDPG